MIISAAICALGWGAVSAYAAEGDESGTALFMPSSYEQYLSLENPSDFAVNEQYIAIADLRSTAGTQNDYIFYILDKSSETPAFRSYSYSTQSTVSSLNLYSCDAGNFLFFIETGNHVFYLNCDALSAPQSVSDFTASSMIIIENDVYSATQTGTTFSVEHSILKDLTFDETTTIAPTLTCGDSHPTFSVYESNVYLAAEQNVYLCTQNAVSPEFTVRSAIKSFAMRGVTASDIVYSDAADCLYIGQENSFVTRDVSGVKNNYHTFQTENEQNTFLLLFDTGIGAYDADAREYTGYEIGKYSSSETRIGANASDISAYGTWLAIADTQNHRITLYENNVYVRTVSAAVAPAIVCAGDSSFLLSDGNSIYLYSYNGDPIAEFARQEFSGAVLSCTYSYGAYYILTSGNSGAVVLTESDAALDRHDFSASATSIASDIYGNLYLYINGEVYRYTSTEFVSDGEGEHLFTVQGADPTAKILSDYSGELYILSGEAIVKYGKNTDGSYVIQTPTFSSADLSGLVYYEEDGGNPPIVSFAFGFESKDVYVLSDGFIAVTQKLGVKSLNDLDADGVYAALFDTPLSADDYNGLLVNVAPGSVVIALDVTELSQNSAVLPYHGYQKTAEAMTGVVLAETGDGTLVGVFTKTPSGEVDVLYSYNVWLVLKDGGEDSVTAVDGARYLSSPDYSDGYVVEAVGLYRFPQMRLGENGSFTDFARIQELPKNTAVTVLQKIGNGALDADYCFVSAELDGQTVYGYVPAGFVLKSGNAGVASGTQFRYARLDRGESATLLHKNTGEGITLSDREQLKVYDSITDENGNVYAEYTNENGTYAGYIDPAILYEATPVVMVTLVIVMVAAAAVILSVCYLLLRKQPTLQ